MGYRTIACLPCFASMVASAELGRARFGLEADEAFDSGNHLLDEQGKARIERRDRAVLPAQDERLVGKEWQIGRQHGMGLGVDGEQSCLSGSLPGIATLMIGNRRELLGDKPNQRRDDAVVPGSESRTRQARFSKRGQDTFDEVERNAQVADQVRAYERSDVGMLTDRGSVPREKILEVRSPVLPVPFRGHVSENLPDDLGQNMVLGRDIPVDRGRVDAKAIGQVPKGKAGDAMRIDLRERGVDDRVSAESTFPGFLGRSFHRGKLRPCRRGRQPGAQKSPEQVPKT